MNYFRLHFTIVLLSALTLIANAQKTNQVTFHISLDQANQTYHVTMKIPAIKQDTLLLKMPAWTPGYYQMLNFVNNVSNIKAYTSNGTKLLIQRQHKNGWKVASPGKKAITVEYDVKATRSFVATPYLDRNRGFISPPGIFLHIAGALNNPAMVTVTLPSGWTAASGMESNHSDNSFMASDFDVLYDSPILLGPLEELPSFTVAGVKHRFIGYNLGEFDRNSFIADLEKIVTTSINLIGHIPYKEYTFLAIGPGPGGIEHLNSTTFGWSAESLKTSAGKRKLYTFLAHEYFHHYNVKRIRPIELGPFDYDKENRTNMLWVAEGFTVYYDLLITRRAGLMTDEELLESIRDRLLGFENKPGRLYQSATQASYNTWSDGPFGRSEDEVNKTVSVYDKGAILGLLLDLNIRHATNNSKSLDDVMRTLYTEFYQQKKRGFKETEFQEVCERIAGTKLTEVFQYASTTAAIDYKKYLAYAGLMIDSEEKPLPGGWLGIATRMRNDSVVISNVDYESPAWKAGLRRQMIITKSEQPITPILQDNAAGDLVALRTFHKGKTENYIIPLATKSEASFQITPMSNAAAAERTLFKSWMVGAR
jgi:predicted metalloprotease with PDZ domain